MSQIDIFNKQSKFIRVLCYLILSSFVAGYAGASAWVIKRVIDQPKILENYAKKIDLAHEVNLKWESLCTKINNNNNRMDRLEDSMNNEFSKLETSMEKKFDKVEISIEKKFNKIEGLLNK